MAPSPIMASIPADGAKNRVIQPAEKGTWAAVVASSGRGETQQSSFAGALVGPGRPSEAGGAAPRL